MIFQTELQAKELTRRIGVRYEKGQGLIEYGLIILLASIVVIVVLTLFGEQIRDFFETITGIFAGD